MHDIGRTHQEFLNAKAGETYYFVTEYGELIPDQFTLHQVDPLI
jgi:hypothetical protein